jgi:hypothetical protein
MKELVARLTLKFDIYYRNRILNSGGVKAARRARKSTLEMEKC